MGVSTAPYLFIFIYLGFYVTFNTVQVGRAEETSTYSWSRFCTVNCRPTASNYQLSHLRPCREPNPGLRGGRRECYHSATVAPTAPYTQFCWSTSPPVTDFCFNVWVRIPLNQSHHDQHIVFAQCYEKFT